jgi:hypothetical protein
LSEIIFSNPPVVFDHVDFIDRNPILFEMLFRRLVVLPHYWGNLFKEFCDEFTREMNRHRMESSASIEAARSSRG